MANLEFRYSIGLAYMYVYIYIYIFADIPNQSLHYISNTLFCLELEYPVQCITVEKGAEIVLLTGKGGITMLNIPSETLTYLFNPQLGYIFDKCMIHLKGTLYLTGGYYNPRVMLLDVSTKKIIKHYFDQSDVCGMTKIYI